MTCWYLGHFYFAFKLFLNVYGWSCIFLTHQSIIKANLRALLITTIMRKCYNALVFVFRKVFNLTFAPGNSQGQMSNWRLWSAREWWYLGCYCLFPILNLNLIISSNLILKAVCVLLRDHSIQRDFRELNTVHVQGFSQTWLHNLRCIKILYYPFMSATIYY